MALDATEVNVQDRQFADQSRCVVSADSNKSTINVYGASTEKPAILVQGEGDLLEFRDTNGDPVFTVGNDGNMAALGFNMPVIPPATVRPMWRDGTVVTTFQSGHGWTVGSGAGSASSEANDTTTFVKGTQSARVTTAANGSQSQIRKTGLSSMDLTDKSIRLTFKVADVTNLDHINFYVGTSNFTNFYNFLVHTHSTTTTQNWVQSGEWVTMTVSWAYLSSAGGSYSISSTGTPSVTSGFTEMQFAVYDNSGGAVTYNLQSIEIIDSTAATFPNGVVSVTFDDSNESVYDYARPKLDALGWRATNYVIASSLGASGKLTTTELRVLQDLSGWEISGHSYDANVHTNRLTSYSEARVDKDMKQLRAWLVTNGFYGDGYAYPGGNFSYTTDGTPIEQIVARYFGHGRSITNPTESSAPAMPYRLRAQTGINDGSGLGGITVTALTAANGLLDKVLNGGGWLILCFHQIVTGSPANSTEISQTGFNTVMDEINSRGIKVLPVGDVLRYYS